MTLHNKEGLEALLPCPFCGSDDTNTEGPCYTQFMCNGCGASIYDQSGREEAIAAWNRRALRSQQAPAGVVKGLEMAKAALTPLAAIADDYDDAEDDDFQVWQDFDVLGARLPLKRFRAAREALAALTSPPDAGGVDAHPDDLAVDRFAAAMKAKLAKKRAEGRSGWDNKEECSAEFLSQLLREHVEKGDPVDVGNLSMMLHQRGERIAK